MNIKIIFFVIFFCCFPFCKIWGRNDSLIVVTFGNSTTAPRKGIEKVYSVRLQEKLLEAEIPAVMINSGVPSSHSGSVNDNDFAKVRHGMDRFFEDVVNHYPDWVIINFGLNDAHQDSGERGEARISLENYKKNIEYYIDVIEKHNGKVIVLTPNPLGSKYEEFRINQVKKYADAIRKTAFEKNVILVDSWILFYENSVDNNQPGNIDYIFTDGIHPNDYGHEIIAEAVFKKIMIYHLIK